MRQIKDAIANHERLVGKLRTKAAMKAKARRVERVGALRYGYDVADDGPRSR